MAGKKPDDTTWDEYVFGQAESDEEVKSRRPEFGEFAVGAAREALRESDELDESRFEVVKDVHERWASVEPEGWTMDEDDVVRVRDALREQDIGDESVGVFCEPRSTGDGGPAPLPPDELGYDVEYSVGVKLRREVEMFDQAAGEAKDKMNEKLEENFGE